MRRGCLPALVAGLLLLGCTAEPSARPDRPARSSPSASVASPSAGTATPTPTQEPTDEPSPSIEPSPRPVRFSAARAMKDVRHLAGRIGPRLANVPRLDRATVEGAGHFVHVEQPGAVAALLLDYLER